MRLKLLAASSNAEVTRITDQLFLLDQARWITPDVSILKAKSRSQVDLPVVQRSLPASTAILEYVLADPLSYCLVITNRAARTIPLESGSKIERDVIGYLTSVKVKKPVPVFGWFTSRGSTIEGIGVSPDEEVDPLPDLFESGDDRQLSAAIAALC